MKKKLLSVVLATGMVASLLVGCGSDDSSKETTTAAGSSNQTTGGNVATEEQGSVLNIYCWNEEFKTRIKDHYPGYEEIDATTGKIGDVEVRWSITPSDNNAYQNNLDEQLKKQLAGELSDDEKIDIFLTDADYTLKYVNSEATIDVKSLGITDEDISNQYKYTQGYATDDNGVLKGLSWQATPGVFFYNREFAKEVFGTDDPAAIQEYVKDWDTFKTSAASLKDAGYTITSSVMDTFRVYSNNVTSKWVEDGKINIDANIEKWAKDSKEMYDAGYTNAFGMWTPDWQQGFYPEGKVFGYFGPAWLINFCMAADAEGSVGYNGGWAATEGPQSFFWGGTWIHGATGSDNTALIKDIMLKLTTDADIMRDIATADSDFVNYQSIMEEMAQTSAGQSAILGGQNALPIYVAGVADIDMSYISSYDSGCNAEFQSAMGDYFEGAVSYDEAIESFYTGIGELYPELAQ